MTKILIIFNPKAGRKYPKNFKELVVKSLYRLLPAIIFDWQETLPTFQNQLKTINFHQYTKILIIGGDGTIRDVADYLLKNNLDLPLGIIPAGSANILASSLNIPHSFKQAIKTASIGQEKKIDVCHLNNQEYFLTCLSLGHWSKIIQKTSAKVKISLGILAYLLTLIKHWQIPRTTFKFNLDGQTYQIPGHTLVIANALSVLKLKPKTKIDLTDGQLEVLINKNKTVWGFMAIFFSFFWGKRKFPLLFKAKGEKIIIDLAAEKETFIQIDGEIRKVEKIEVEIVPKKLRVIV